MLLYPPEPQIDDMDGFTPENDIFGLREFGESLTNLVTSVDQPLVLTLDGPWGSGKSTFAKQWAGELRKRGLPVILFDAFANDHQEDAFVALAGEFATKASALENDNELRQSFLETAKKVGGVLAPIAVKALLHGATAGLLPSGELKGIGKAIDAGLSRASSDFGDAIEAAIGSRIEEAKADKDALSEFKEELGKLAGRLSEQTATKSELGDGVTVPHPLVFIIDELDRCRPPFALSILERIKHLFSVEGVCFVLITNLEQLEAAVRGTYGMDTAARAYLDKFVHLRFRLPEQNSERHSQERRERYIDHLWTRMGLQSVERQGVGDTRELLNILAKVHNLNLRDLERIAGYIALVYAVTTKQHPSLEPFLSVLAVMRLIRRDLYDKARVGRLAQADVQEILALNLWDDEIDSDWVSEWWQFAIDPNSVDENKSDRLHRFVAQYRMRPENLLPEAVRLMEQFHPTGE